MFRMWEGYLFVEDVEYLKSLCVVKGDLTRHIRAAVNEYVQRLKEART